MAGMRFEDIAKNLGWTPPANQQTKQSRGQQAPTPPPKRWAGMTVRQRVIVVGLFMILLLGYGMGKGADSKAHVTCDTTPTTTQEQEDAG